MESQKYPRGAFVFISQVSAASPVNCRPHALRAKHSLLTIFPNYLVLKSQDSHFHEFEVDVYQKHWSSGETSE